MRTTTALTLSLFALTSPGIGQTSLDVAPVVIVYVQNGHAPTSVVRQAQRLAGAMFADINVTMAMALAITLAAHFLGFKKSPKHYISHYFQPFWPMVLMHAVDEVAKPLTHGMRLWANIFAGEVLIIVMVKGSWFLTGAPLIVWLGYSLFVGTIQAYVFTVLAMVYMAQKIES